MNTKTLFRVLTLYLLGAPIALAADEPAKEPTKEQPKILWQKPFGAEVSPLTMAEDGSGVLVTTRVRTSKGYQPRYLNFVDAKGTTRWKHVPTKEDIGGVAVSGDGQIIAVSEYFGDPKTIDISNDDITGEDLVLLDRDGKQKWRRTTEPSIDLLMSHQGDIIASIGARGIKVFDSKGALLWEQELFGEPSFENAFLSPDGTRLLTVRDDGLLQLFGAKGQVLWQHQERYENGSIGQDGRIATSSDLRYLAARAQPDGSEVRFFDTTEGTSWSARLDLPSQKLKPSISGISLDAKGETGLLVAYLPDEKGVTAEHIYRFGQDKRLILLQERKINREVKGSMRARESWIDAAGKYGAVLLSPLGMDALKQLLIIDMASGNTRLLDFPPSQAVTVTPDLRFAATYDSKGKVTLFDLGPTNPVVANAP